MVVSIHIGFRHFGTKTISVIVDYTITARKLNSTTIIYVLEVELLDGGDINNHWCIRVLFPINEASSTPFHDFLEKFIRRVLITDSVLSSIGALKLVLFQNRMDELDFPKLQQTALNILRNFMFHKGITVIVHDDLVFCDAIFADESDLALSGYTIENKKIMSHDDLNNDMKIQAAKVV